MTPQEQWEKCLKFVSKWEGGWSDDKYDKGGKTKYGITEAVYKDARAKLIVRASSIEALTKAEADKIYRMKYYDAYMLSALPYKAALVCFDTVVNMGSGGLADVVQWACIKLGASLKWDKLWGPLTQSALIVKMENPQLPALMIEARRARYERIVKNNPVQRRFIRGWMNRVIDLEKEVVKL
ncbi:hypothetical protein FACS1894216_01440 [Synergistales bacterium]|nr:hypothetical protein FACS1894216_01440 [Synergistales bacterium]